jgi:BASS family bile acid:Na+ symporter
LATGLASVWQLAVSPVLVWGAATGIGLPPSLVAALVLNAAASPLMSVPAFARLLGLDVELAVVVLAGTTLLLPITLAPVVLGLLSRETAIDPADYAARVAVFLVLPLAAAWTVRRLAGADRIDSFDERLQGLTVVVLLVFAIAVMDGVTPRILSEPRTVLLYLSAAFALNLGFQILTPMLFYRTGRRTALSLGLISGNRNMALVFAVTGAIEPDLLLYLAVAQVPIYVSPLLTQRLYGRLLRPGS